MSKKVFVGMSGGVDSSVAAALLGEQGYDVTGVYMKNWSEDLPGMHCPWAEDVADAKRVAVGLGIDFRVFDFQKEYKQNVVDYMIREYQAGRTPNPDIMCNQEVKFKIFWRLRWRLERIVLRQGIMRVLLTNRLRQPNYYALVMIIKTKRISYIE